MKTVGILGGMSWESTAVYYRRLNEIVQQTAGGVSSAAIILHSFDFARIEELQHHEDWDSLANMLTDAGRGLKSAGADFLVIATNTMHLLADRIQADSGLPVLHIADAAAEWIAARSYTKVALLGTKFTMEKPFYAERINAASGARVLIPDPAERDVIHATIYTELCAGLISDASRDRIVSIINRLGTEGAQCAILGCTELPLLVRDGQPSIPVVDTMELHIQAAARLALNGA